VKYNHEGGTVSVTVHRDESDGMAVIRVNDTGQGIPGEHLPRIFERFYRVDKSRSREQGGTGLGLAIVKHIVRTHRGRLEVTSEPGMGTTFEVRLPLA
jgi:two-component system phosphate regulon sensor histidine kinase PhoR